ncbi:MAG: VWA domain-containing protein [Bdellovibrionaceae bacterium]|nr:VWA domain-containing protein [Bdellovibrionales bacterium]MCB9254890.1 VWA domain-containing protein [Pseudobdellovibrionaceae bacterium]
MQLQFQNPELLWGLLPVLVLAWIMLAKRQRPNARFSLRHMLLSLFAFAFCVLALARPQLGKHISSRQGAGSNVFLAIDISRSMVAEDIRPSRLGFVTSSLEVLADALNESRVALFPFAADGYLQVPLTSDLSGILTITPTLSPEMTTDQGTDLSQSMQTLLRHIFQLEEKAKQRGETWFPSQVILFSDGESHEALRKEVFARYKAKGIPIHTVGTGTAGGAPIPIHSFQFERFGRTPYLKDGKGNTVTTKLNAEPLQEISNLTGGNYFNADLTSILDLGERLRQGGRASQVVTSVEVAREFYPILLSIALLLFTIEFGMGRWEYAIRLLPLLLVPYTLVGASVSEITQSLEKATDPLVRSTLTFNLGVAYMKERKLDKAAEYFQESAYMTDDPILKKKALFNLGNTFVYSQEPQKALESYQSAYDTKSEATEFEKDTNRKLSENMALVSRIMQSASQQGSDDEDNKSGQQPQDSKGPKKDYDKEQFSQERKQRIFDMMAREEQQTIQRLQRDKNQKADASPKGKQW